ncbi:MAG: serine/threonine-protein kinase, partial [Planctomycetota bacterium]
MPNADPNDPFIGKKLGNYRIERKLGEGGMGVVYLAMHLVFGSRVAVKILPPLIASDAEKRTRFFLEAEAAYRLRHPNIISALDAGQDELTRQCYFVMELCEGQSLRALLKESGPWPLARAMPLFRGLLDGMACAHDAGIIHRDIKPDNVMLEPDGRPRLADFGLARDLANDNRLTTSGMVFGTPHYMPPEQWKGENIDARSDQYALGVVFMEVLSGELPVKGSTPTALLSRLLAGDVTRLSQLPVSRSLPGLLVQAVERMCELDASRRFADIAAVRAALSALHVDDASGGTGVTYATLMEFGPSASAPPVQPRAPATMPGSFDGIAVERRTEEGSLMATMPGRRVDPPAPPGLLPDQPARGRAALVGVIVLLLACVGVVVAMASSA